MASRAIIGCLASSPIPLLLSEASLPPLRVTLTHFARLFYKRALCLPNSFPIPGLARLGVKPSTFQILLRAFGSIHLLIHSSREVLFACPSLLKTCLPLLRSPPFSPHALVLTLIFVAKVRLLLILTLSHHTLWLSGQMALFVLSKTTLTSLPTTYFVAHRSLFPFWQAQYIKIFPLKTAPFCKLSAGLGSTNSAISLFLGL